MNKRLPFTYDEPGPEDARLWTPGTSRDERVAILWTPTIGCSAEQCERKTSLTKAPGIPWSAINIAEIRVESRKAYEILCRIVPNGQDFFVRINPPKPDPSDPRLSNCHDVAIFVEDNINEFPLAASIARGLSGKDVVIVKGIDWTIMERSEVVVFCHRAAASVLHLTKAISQQAKILSSDAGAAEEYLTNHAAPGRWHVARSWDSKEWLNMIRDLLGDQNDVSQSSAVDQTPYIIAWGNV